MRIPYTTKILIVVAIVGILASVGNISYRGPVTNTLEDIIGGVRGWQYRTLIKWNYKKVSH